MRAQVPPSALGTDTPLAANQILSGVPPLFQPRSGVASCNNLFSASPPMLGERFEVYSLAVPAIAEFSSASGAAWTKAPNIRLSMDLYVNSELAYTMEDEGPGISYGSASNYALLSTTFAADLINPVYVGSRERLSIRLSTSCDQAAATAYVYAAMVLQFSSATPDGVIQGAEGTISYNAVELPTARRL